MPEKDEIVAKIAEKTGLKSEVIEEKIRAKQEEYAGLLTEAGAAYAVAREEGIDFAGKAEELKIRDVRPGIDQVTVKGEVVRVFAAKEWASGTKKGRIASFVIRDDTGEIRTVLWNDETELLKTVQRGATLEVRDAVARDRNGMPELSLGRRGRLVVAKPAEAKNVRLADIAEGMTDANFYARVLRVFAPREFEREGRKGKVTTIVVSDGTERRLALWDEQTDAATALKPGETVLVEGAYVRMNRGEPELNLGRRGRLVANPPGAPRIELAPQRSSIHALQAGKRESVRATIVQAFEPRVFEACSVCRRKAEGGTHCGAPTRQSMSLNFILDDGTGVIRAVAFGEQAEKLLGFSADDYARNKNLFDENKILGEELRFDGVVKKNTVFDRLEFAVNATRPVDVQEEIRMVA